MHEVDGGGLHPAHDDLLAQSSSRSVFLTADWLRTWLEVFGASHDILSLAFHSGGELVGLAPLAVARQPGVVPLRRLLVMGQRPTSGEHLDAIALPGYETAVAEALADGLTGPLRRRWDVLTFQRVLADAPVLRHLPAALGHHGCPVDVLPTGDSPYVSVPGPGGNLLAGKSKNFREQARQTRRRVHQLGQVELQVVGSDLDLDTGFAELVSLHRSRWADASSFDTPDKLRFHQRLSERFVDRGQLYLSVLSVDGATIGARYDFVYDQRMWCIQGGWNPAHSAARPGMFLTEAALEWAMSHGLREYDFLGGASEYKTRWSTGARPLVALSAVNRSTVAGRLYRLAARGKGLRSR